MDLEEEKFLEILAKNIEQTKNLVVISLFHTVVSNKEDYYVIHAVPVTKIGIIRYDSLIFQDFNRYTNKEEADRAMVRCIERAKAWGWTVMTKEAQEAKQE